MEIPDLRKPERQRRSSLGLFVIVAFCLGLSAAWFFSKRKGNDGVRMGLGGIGSTAARPQAPMPEYASRGTASNGSQTREQGTSQQAGERGEIVDAALPEGATSARSAPYAAEGEGGGAALGGSQGLGDASAGGGQGSPSARGGAADGAAAKIPIKWQPLEAVSLQPGEGAPAAGRLGRSARGAPSSAKRSKGAAFDEDAMFSYLNGLQAQAAKLTKEQARQIQKAIAAEEGRLEQAMAKAPPFKPPPASTPLVRGKVWPVQGGGRVSQEFGASNWDVYAGRTYNGKYYPHFHTGIDIAAPKGTPLVAFDAGRVIKAGGNQQSGVNVIVQHP